MPNAKKFRAFCLIVALLGASNLIQSPSALPFAPVRARAQGKACPDLVRAALAATDKGCVNTGRNKVCYGNSSINAQAQPGTALQFSKPGDIVSVGSIQAIRLGALDAANNTWGIAMLRLQANLPDTAPGQNVTMLLFGDVEVADGSKTAPSATESATALKPMQAFYFRSGVGQPACAQAPSDGILIQTPGEAKQKVVLVADEVRIELGSTVFLQAQATKELIVTTLQGSAQVTSFGRTEKGSVAKID
jgi:hypothetical protein